MKRLVVALLLFAGRADAFDLDATIGGGVAATQSSGPTTGLFPAFDLATTFQFLRTRVSPALQLRTALWFSNNWTGHLFPQSAGVGVRVNLTDRLFGRLLVGGEVVFPCLLGDICPSIGPDVSVEIGARFGEGPVRLVALARFELVFFFGQPLFNPMASMGIAW
jgi:hypothetical protein